MLSSDQVSSGQRWSEFNSEFGDKLEWSQVGKKWGNMKVKAKDDQGTAKKGRRVTGGGPKDYEDITESSQAVFEFVGRSTGIHGRTRRIFRRNVI